MDIMAEDISEREERLVAVVFACLQAIEQATRWEQPCPHIVAQLGLA